MTHFKHHLVALLRRTERYTKTDMVYLLHTGLWVNLNVIVLSALSLLLAIALANLLSPDSYGLYQYLLSLSVLVAAISLSGMNAAVAQATARGYEGVLRTAVRVQFKWAIVPALASLAGALYYFLQGNNAVGIGLVAIAIITPFSNAFNTYVGYLEGKREFRTSFLLGSLVNIVSYLSIFLAVILVRNATTLVIVNLTVNCAAMAFAYYRTLKIYQPTDSHDPKAITYGRHLSVTSAFGTVMNQLDSVLVFHFLGAAELAVYALATMLPERIGTLFNFVGTASLPKFSNQSLEHIRKHILGKILRVLLAGAVAAFLYALIAPLIFHWLFPRYLSAIQYSVLYAPVIILLAVTSLVNTALVAKRLTRDIYVLSFAQPVLLVGLQVPLLLLYGLWGMIAARLISDVVGICLALWFTFKPLTKTTENELGSRIGK